MNSKKLLNHADKGSISASVDHESLIVTVLFELKGVPFRCLFDPDNEGVYAFNCHDIEKLIDITDTI